MPRRLAQQRMLLSDLEWPFHVSRDISAVAELLILVLNLFVCLVFLSLVLRFSTVNK